MFGCSDKISGNLLGFPNINPFVVAIWYGNGKPSNVNDYLDQFVNELVEVLANGITINNHHINIAIRCFICDTPARSLIKGNQKKVLNVLI